jgi:hypothetical protein
VNRRITRDRRNFARVPRIPAPQITSLLLLLLLVLSLLLCGCDDATLLLSPSPLTGEEEHTSTPQARCEHIDTSNFAGWAEKERCLNGRGGGRPIPLP